MLPTDKIGRRALSAAGNICCNSLISVASSSPSIAQILCSLSATVQRPRLTISQRVTHRQIFATVTELFSRHAQRFVGFAVVTAAVGESGVKNRCSHASPFASNCANGERAGLSRFRRHPVVALNNRCKMKWTHRHRSAKASSVTGVSRSRSRQAWVILSRRCCRGLALSG